MVKVQVSSVVNQFDDFQSDFSTSRRPSQSQSQNNKQAIILDKQADPFGGFNFDFGTGNNQAKDDTAVNVDFGKSDIFGNASKAAELDTFNFSAPAKKP